MPRKKKEIIEDNTLVETKEEPVVETNEEKTDDKKSLLEIEEKKQKDEAFEKRIESKQQKSESKRIKKFKKSKSREHIERLETNINTGLNEEQVNERLQKGYVNVKSNKTTKSVQKIIFTNIFS